MKRFINYIGSRRFAVYLLVITTAVILFANLLPNPRMMDAEDIEELKIERPLLYSLSANAGVDHIIKSRFFQILPLFIFLSITICTIKRTRKEIRKGKKGSNIPPKPSIKYNFTSTHSLIDKEEIYSLLSDRAWKNIEPVHNGNLIIASKGGNGFWGSVIFHLGMDVVLLGVLLSVMMGVSGIIRLTEGFAFPTEDAFTETDREKAADFPLKSIYLDTFEATYQDGKFHIAYEARLLGKHKSGKVKKYVTKVNDPLRIDEYTVIFGKGGYAPRFILKSTDGTVLDDVAANLMITMPGKIDTLFFPDEGLTIDAELFPDYYEEGGEPKTRSDVPNNPVIFVEVSRWDKVIGRGFLHIGQEVGLDGYKLEFRELRHWIELVITKDVGVIVILYGFMLIVIGLAVRFILNDRLIWLIIEKDEKGTKVSLGGRCGYFPAMFDDELKKLTEDMRIRCINDKN